MIDIIFAEISQGLFVGRVNELRNLQKIWNLICESSGEHYAYSLLNTSGIGKTTLLEHFATKIIENNQGLPIRILASFDDRDYNLYVSNWLNSFRNCVVNNKLFIENYIKTNYKSEIINEKIEEFQEILKDFNEEKNKRIYNYNIVPRLIKSLSNIIPILLVIDEVQVWQEIKFMSELNKEETALHCMARSVAQLLNAKVLMIFSGTQYRILSEIGRDIGSPIRNKVRPILIQLFSQEDIKNYAKEIKNRIIKYIKEEDKEALNICVKSYEEFLLKFSGGHARTIQFITEYFIDKLESLISLAKINKEKFNNEFIELFLKPQTVKLFIPQLKEHLRNAIRDIQKKIEYKKVHEWIIRNAMQSLKLGQGDGLNYNELEILEDLVHVGILAKNSEDNYYLTSYFHLLAYLDAIEDENTIFLKEVLENKYFVRLCGSHSGLGYVFEEVLLSVFLLIPKTKIGFEINKDQLPFNALKDYEVIVSNERIDFSKIEIRDNTINHYRMSEGIDFIIRDGEKIILIQITTVGIKMKDKIEANMNIIGDKIKGLIEVGKKLQENQIVKRDELKVIGWIISLFEIKDEKIRERIEIPEWIRIDDGEKVKNLIGDKLYQKIYQTKIFI